MSWSALLDDMAEVGLRPGAIVADGAFHRFAVDGDKPGERAGWYKASGDSPRQARYGDHRRQVTHHWCERMVGTATRTSEARGIRRTGEDRSRGYDEAAKLAEYLWQSADPHYGSHRYLRDKDVKAYGLRKLRDSLVVPLQDVTGALRSLQFISPAGQKRFLRGGQTRGCYFTIGRPTRQAWLVEGYATGASLHVDTGEQVLVAFSAGNLMSVAEALLRGGREVLSIMADDDWQTPENPGVAAAKAVAEALGLDWYLPEFPADRPRWATDFNDACRLWTRKAGGPSA